MLGDFTEEELGEPEKNVFFKDHYVIEYSLRTASL
jgi:hypothetical protein